tara:strand:+ start:547 stop:837 length:291 start_codon:yes stop_codon:yes gene_type:complete
MQIKEKVHFDKKEDKIIIEKTYDNQGVLDRAENLRKGKHGMTGENRLVGSIPIHIVAQWCKDVGVKWDDIEARKEVVRKNILSGEFDKFRVWKGTF